MNVDSAKEQSNQLVSDLASELARFVYSVRLQGREVEVALAKAFVLDALAATLGGLDSDAVAKSINGLRPFDIPGATPVTLFGTREEVSPALAAFVHGAALRYLDVMDYYVSVDVSHPSEIIPVILAYAQAARASGKEVLECVIAGYLVHIALTDTIPLHSIGLHHVGQAAIVVPLVVSRLMGLSVETAAMALSISATRFLVPEGFARGHLATVKALAYPLQARHAAEAVGLAALGFAGNLKVLEEILDMLVIRFGAKVSADQFRAALKAADSRRVLLKAYPAQYTLQGLVVAAVAAAAAQPGLHERIERVEVHSSARSIERTADPAKFKPATREAADHSLPYCVAIALMEGRMDVDQIKQGRWKDDDVLAMMERIETHCLPGELGFNSGVQFMVIHMSDGNVRTLSCPYPPKDASHWGIALEKLRRFATTERVDVQRLADTVGALESLEDISTLCLFFADHH